MGRGVRPLWPLHGFDCRALSAFTDSKLQLQPGNEKAKMLTQEKTDEPNVHQIGNRRTHTGRVASEHTASSIVHREVRM